MILQDPSILYERLMVLLKKPSVKEDSGFLFFERFKTFPDLTISNYLEYHEKLLKFSDQPLKGHFKYGDYGDVFQRKLTYWV
jgi:hypothetical protein